MTPSDINDENFEQKRLCDLAMMLGYDDTSFDSETENDPGRGAKKDESPATP